MADIDPLDLEVSEHDEPVELPEFDDEAVASEAVAEEPEVEEVEQEAEVDDTAQLRAEVEALRQEKAAARAAEQARIEQERIAQLEAKEKELDDLRVAALEADDIEEFRRLDSELLDVRLQRRMKPEPAKVDDDAEARRAPAAKAWLAKNPWYHTDLAKAEKAYALQEYLRTVKGMSIEDPKLWVELDRRLSGEKPKQRSGQVAGVSRGNAVTAQRSTAPQKRLSSADLRTMAKYGFDPQSSRDRRTWANRNTPLN